MNFRTGFRSLCTFYSVDTAVELQSFNNSYLALQTNIVLRLPNLGGNARIFKEVTVIGPGFMNLDPFILHAHYYYYGHEHHLCDLRQKIARLRDRVSLLWKLLLFWQVQSNRSSKKTYTSYLDRF